MLLAECRGAGRPGIAQPLRKTFDQRSKLLDLAGARPYPEQAASLRARVLEASAQLVLKCPGQRGRCGSGERHGAALAPVARTYRETASARLVAPSLRRMFLTWYLTVPSRTTSARAIARFV